MYTAQRREAIGERRCLQRKKGQCKSPRENLKCVCHEDTETVGICFLSKKKKQDSLGWVSGAKPRAQLGRVPQRPRVDKIVFANF